MHTNQYEQEAHKMIDHIFRAILPDYGMAERPAQIKLSHEMLEAMLGGKIALCDAGTGIGKTYAYLVAGAVADRCRGTKPFQPILISTSSIALQGAVLEEYLPKLSHALLMAGLIDTPLQAVVRKGKSHYVCDKLLEKRLRQVSGAKKNAKVLAALEALRETLDMDRVAHLSHYNKERVCVPQVCHCDREDCRYQRFLHGCGTEQFLFQICNHNLFLADAIHREQGKRPIFPTHSIAILDEAHKLPETARQMFGVMLTAGQLQELIEELQNAKYLLAAETLEQTAKPLLEKLAQPREETEALEEFLRLLAPLTRSMPIVQRQVGRLLPSPGRKRMDTLASAVALFSRNDSEMLFYLAEDESGGTMLCATPADLTAKLRQTLWRTECSFVLTSGTLAVGNDFQRYRTQVGLREECRVQESVAHSPFDYHEHCLRYLPLFPPKQRAGQAEEYFDELTAEIMDLLKASYGHALVLFTSYAAMSAVKDRLQKEILRVPLFTLGRNAVHILEEFRATPGSVLLATGAAWEGIDFPGDCVSLLIIPRLPFAYPDALKEKEQEQYPSLPAFLEAVAVPEMQIKLRQGFGRAIRTEQDTCVIAILDDRAGQGRRYAQVTKHPERLRVAAYCRVSSDSADQLHSYATQIRSYTEYISQQDGWELVDIYADEGLTGTRIEQRTEFQRMMADCRKGKIDRILVKSISRFSRNTKDCLTALRELAKLGVTVKFEKENIDTGTLTTELMVSVSGSLAQQESISISQNQRMSYQRRMAKGEFITCYAPYGYTIQGKDLQIDQAQAKVVQEIFRWYLSGKGVEQIAEELTRQEIPTGFEKPVWSERAVRYILKNEKYIGDTLCQKTYSTDAFPFINRENHGERDQYYIENTHPSIISRSDFEKVQQLLKQKAERQHKAKGFYPLSRRMSCGKCGATLVRRESKSGYTCWVCKRYDEKRTLCEIGRIPETQIYAAFLRMYQKLRQYKEILLKPARKQLDDLRTVMQRKDPMILKLNQEIAERMEQEYELSKLYSAGVLDMDAYMMRASEVQARVVKLKTMRRQHLKLEKLDEAAEMLQRVEDILQAGPDVLENFEIELFNSLVEKITTVSQNQIRFHIYGGIEVEEYLGGVKR